VYWFPKWQGQLFWRLYRIYLEAVRPQSRLPWLFLTEQGQPLTADAFAEQHAAAMRRLGIMPAKRLGTTPHGHRHAYGQRLEIAKRAGLLDEKIVQLCLHHGSVLSQSVYTAPSSTEIRKLLEAANSRLFPERDDLMSKL